MLRMLLPSFFCFFAITQVMGNEDSLRKVFYTKNSKGFILAARELKLIYIQNNRDSLLTLGKRLTNIGIQTKNWEAEAVGKQCLGTYFRRIGEQKLAREILTESRELFRINKRVDDEVVALNEIGNTYFAEGSLKTAETYYQLSLKCSDNCQLPISKVTSKINLAKCYIRKNEFDVAYKLLQEYIKVSRENQKLIPEIDGYAALANLYLAQEKNDLAREALKKSISLAQKSNSLLQLGLANQNLGILNAQTGNYEAALDNFSKSEDIYFEMKNVNLIMDLYYNFGALYLLEKKFDKAMLYFNQSLDFAKLYKNKLAEVDAIEALIETSQTGNYLTRLPILEEQLLTAKISLNDDKTNRKIESIELAAGLNKLQSTYIEQQRLKEIEKRNQKSNETKQLVVFATFILISLLFLVLYKLRAKKDA